MSVDSNCWEPKIIIFACNWGTYSAPYLASLNHPEYPVNVRVIRTPCLGRMDPQFIYQTFQNSADGVLIVSGCSNGDGCYLASDCIYNIKDHRQIKEYLSHAGVEKERYQASWPSEQDGLNFAEAFTLLIYEIRKLGPYKKHCFPIISDGTEVDARVYR